MSGDGESYAFTKGDLVTFRPEMTCVWKVLEPIRKGAAPLFL